MYLPTNSVSLAKTKRSRQLMNNIEPGLLSPAFLPLKQGISPQSCGCGKKVKEGKDEYVYAFGSIVPMFPSQSVEQEFYQLAVTDSADKTLPFTSALAYKYLRRTENFYLARNILWVFQISGFQKTHIIEPTSNQNLAELLSAVNPGNNEDVLYHVLVGEMTGKVEKDTTTVPIGPGAPENTAIAESSWLPVVRFKKIYNLVQAQYINQIIQMINSSDPQEQNLDDQTMSTIFNTAMQLTQNQGNTDEHRALNFILTRYVPFYMNMYMLYQGITSETGVSADQDMASTYTLSAVQPQKPVTSGRQTTIEIVFGFQSQTGAFARYSIIVDVSTIFPYIVQDWAPFVLI